MHDRGMRSLDDVRVEPFDVTDLFADADLGFMRRAVAAGGKVYAARFDGGKDLSRYATQPETTFSTS